MLALSHGAYALLVFASTVAMLLLFVSAIGGKRPE